MMFFSRQLAEVGLNNEPYFRNQENVYKQNVFRRKLRLTINENLFERSILEYTKEHKQPIGNIKSRALGMS